MESDGPQQEEGGAGPQQPPVLEAAGTVTGTEEGPQHPPLLAGVASAGGQQLLALVAAGEGPQHPVAAAAGGQHADVDGCFARISADALALSSMLLGARTRGNCPRWTARSPRTLKCEA